MNASERVIVVGVDGSQDGDEALRFAYQEAQATGDALEVITTWEAEPTLATPYAVVGELPSYEELHQQAHKAQERAIVRVCGWEPAISIQRRVVHGQPGPILTRASKFARILVVGTHGYGAFRAAVLGSVSRYCAQHATCPVLVVPVPHTAGTSSATSKVTGAGDGERELLVAVHRS